MRNMNWVIPVLVVGIFAAGLMWKTNTQLENSLEANRNFLRQTLEPSSVRLPTKPVETSPNDQMELVRLRKEVGELSARLKKIEKIPNNRPVPVEVRANPANEQETKAAWKMENIECMEFAKQMAITWHMQNVDSKGWFPQNMEDLVRVMQIREDSKFKEMERIETFEVTYRGSLDDVTEPGKTIIPKKKLLAPVPMANL